MTDSVLTEEEVTELGRPSTPWDSITRREVIASHRLLQKQVAGLEQQLEVQRLNLKWFDMQLQETERDD